MLVENYLGRFYDVNVRDAADLDDAAEGQRNIEIYERGEDSECIGFFVKLADSPRYEWRNVYGKVASGTIYQNDAAVKAAAKATVFY